MFSLFSATPLAQAQSTPITSPPLPTSLRNREPSLVLLRVDVAQTHTAFLKVQRFHCVLRQTTEIPKIPKVSELVRSYSSYQQTDIAMLVVRRASVQNIPLRVD